MKSLMNWIWFALLQTVEFHGLLFFAGLANPAPIIQTFYAEDQVFNDVKLDGVVTLVDAKHARLHLDEVKPEGVVNEAVEQIAYADRIIVNKVWIITVLPFCIWFRPYSSQIESLQFPRLCCRNKVWMIMVLSLQFPRLCTCVV